ncbi:ABC transporter ATP-binding protein [Nonomuraea sp. NPDC046802]|uniref:ABC transporter ATP-binding protein n=1 Tax=Nonomuraea sp. NPDC046802 TaxID=3154919 RepID=UPI0033FF0AE8
MSGAPTGRWALTAGAAHAARLVARAAPGRMPSYLGITLVASAVPIAVAWLTKLILDHLVARSPFGVLLGLATGLVVAGLVNAVVPQVTQYLRAEVGRRVRLRAQDELFTALERLAGLARFEDPDFLNRLRLAQQSAASPGSIVDAVFGLGRSALTLAGFVGSLLVVTPLFTVMVLAAAVPALLGELRLSQHRAATLWRIGPMERRQMFYADLLGTAYTAKEVRLFGLGAFLRGRMNDETRAADSAQRLMDRRELRVLGALAVLSALVAGGGLVWAIAMASRGVLTVGDVSMFVAAVAGTQGALDGLVSGAATAHHQLTMFGHYLAINRNEPDLPLPARPHPVPPLRHGIELRDVWFRYSDDHPWVLRGVSLFLPRGRSLGLVGLNGAGKSTLVKLLCRFYDPVRGSILWDGVDIREMPVDGLRGRIGAVFQDFAAYDLTAAENIALGDLSALGDTARIAEAGRHAGIHETVDGLPRGYDTLLSRLFSDDSDPDDPQAGVLLSGGQWQRLALARAFLRHDRDLMILDEPSAGLDAQAEHEIHERLRTTRSGRTTVLVSHRLSALKDADLIVVLADGVIAESGSHSALIAASGGYARLFRLQAAGYTENPHGPVLADPASSGQPR